MRFRTLAAFAAVSTLSLLLVAEIAHAGDKSYRLSSIKGSYAGIFTGRIKIGAQLLPFDGTGVFVSDGKGNLRGHETYTIDTAVCDATIEGTYTVNTDGTGTDTADFIASTPGCTGGSYTQSLVIANSGELVLLSNTNGDHISEEWHRQK